MQMPGGSASSSAAKALDQDVLDQAFTGWSRPSTMSSISAVTRDGTVRPLSGHDVGDCFEHAQHLGILTDLVGAAS
ncbi:hypothetical protein HMPREF9946_04788 [Acetobacteraceae bacterium AT-5844]|nr:hypothetical protein HMPREF9946_04788 [Acetobacteraceae bacterium AT-5844]